MSDSLARAIKAKVPDSEHFINQDTLDNYPEFSRGCSELDILDTE